MALLKTFSEWNKNRSEAKALEAKKEAKAKYSTAVKELLKEYQVEEVHELKSDQRKEFFSKLDAKLTEDVALKEAYELAYGETPLTESANGEGEEVISGGENPETDDIKKDSKAADADEQTGQTVIESDEEEEDKEDDQEEEEEIDESKDKDLQNDVVLYIMNTEGAYKHGMKVAKKIAKDGMDSAEKHFAKAVPFLFKMYLKDNAPSSTTLKLDKDDVQKIAAELAERYADEIEDMMESTRLINLFIDSEVNEELSDDSRDVIVSTLEAFESSEMFIDMFLGESGNMQIELVNGAIIDLAITESGFTLGNEAGMLIEAEDSIDFIDEFVNIFEGLLVIEEAAILPNPDLDATSKKMYDDISKAIAKPVHDEGDKKNDDNPGGEKKSEADLVGESKEEEMSAMKAEMKDQEMYSEMEEETFDKVVEMAYETKKAMESACEGVKESYDGYKAEGSCGDYKVEAMVEMKATESEGDAEITTHVDIDGDGAIDMSVEEMDHSKLAEMIKEKCNEMKAAKESADAEGDEGEEKKEEEEVEEGIKVTGNKELAKAIKSYQNDEISFKEFQEIIMGMDESAVKEEEEDKKDDDAKEEEEVEEKIDEKRLDLQDKAKNYTGRNQLKITSALRSYLELTGKGMDDVYFDGSTLVYGDKAVAKNVFKSDMTIEDLIDATKKVMGESSNVDEAKINEADVKDESSFRSYATEVLKSAFKDEFSQERADAVINGLIDKYGKKGDWGAAVGALQAGLAD